MTHTFSKKLTKSLNLILLYLFFLFGYYSQNINAQTPGLIYKPSTSVLGKKVLDPNNDGYTSPNTSGFVTTDYGTGSELKMIPLPVLTTEPHSDIITGGGGGHTDIVSAGGQHSVYVLTKQVDGVDYFVIRFRLGGASTATKGYSLLLDTDGNFGSMLTSTNPGYDIEVAMLTGSSGGVKVYAHSSSGLSTLYSFNIDEYSQRSIALSSVNGNTDYFYDYFVPLSAIGGGTPSRMTAVTVTNAQSALTGTVSDFNGIDDKSYSNNSLSLMSVLINSFPAISLSQLTDTFNYASTWLPKTQAPAVTDQITTSSNSISGYSNEANGTTIQIYKNSTLIGTTTVSSGTWSLTGVTGLIAGDSIKAKALATNKTISDWSNVAIVKNPVLCYAVRPEITASTNSGDKKLTISWTAPLGFTNNGSNVRIKVYQQTGVNTFTFVYDLSPNSEFQYYPTSSTLSYALDGSGGVSGAYFATATYNGCESDYSNVRLEGNASQQGVLTTPDSVLTYPIFASTGNIDIKVKNKFASNAKLYLYVNGKRVDSALNIASQNSYIFTYTRGLREGDIVSSRAQGYGSSDRLSNISNEVIVTSNIQTDAPVITGIYTANTSTSTIVTGYSSEPPGTIIYLYINGVYYQSGSVDAYGNWSITVSASPGLSAGNTITAKAKAVGETLSNSSNTKTVLATAPNAPVITTNPIIANVNNTVSGTIVGNSDSIQLYIDGVLKGRTTATAGNWSVSGIANNEFYKGGEVTAKNYYLGSPSAWSNSVTIVGPDSFRILSYGGVAIGNQTAGVPFNIEIQAFQNGTAINYYSGINFITSSTSSITGGGNTVNFSSGFLSSHQISLQKSGTFRLYTVSLDDPTAKGSSSVVVVAPNKATKLRLSESITDSCLYGQNFPQQPIIEIIDDYGNLVDSSVYNSISITASIFNGTGNLLGTQTINFVNGVATFTNLKVDTMGQFVIEYSPSLLFSTIKDTFYSRAHIWYGGSSNYFNTASNWIDNTIPANNATIQFHTNPINHCLLDQNRTLSNIINAQSIKYFDLNQYSLTLTGKLLFSNAAVIKANIANSKMIFKGTEKQILNPNFFIDNTIDILQIYNSNGVEFNGAYTELVIGNELIFTNGILDTKLASNLVVFVDNASHSGAKSTSFINGKCKKTGNDAFLFPIGKSSQSAPCEISAPSNVTDVFTAEYFNVAYSVKTIKDQTLSLGKSLQYVSDREYWEIDRTNGTSAVDVTLHWKDSAFSGILDMTNGLTLAHFDGSKWEYPGASICSLSGNNSAGSITYPSVSDFSPFTFGSENSFSPLPIHLLSFNAKPISNHVILDWSVSAEKGTQQYFIQKSSDGIEWQTIGTMKDYNELNSLKSFQFIDYNPMNQNVYQLKISDENQKISYSDLRYVNFNLKEEINIYPNPSNGTIISVYVPQLSQFQLYDIAGKLIDKGMIENSYSFENLNRGLYILTVLMDGKNQTFKLVVD